MSEDSPLEDVLVDDEELNEVLLSNTVSKYAKVGSESGRLVPEDPYRNLPSKGKLVVGLLAQKVRFELDLVEQEWLTPTELADLTGVKKGTVYPAVRDLADLGIAESNDGSYRIPTVKINAAKEFLAEETE